MSDLASKTCTPKPGPALSKVAAQKLLRELHRWTLAADGKSIHRTFSFDDYWATMAFVNAAAWIAHQQDHHPDMTVGYNKLKFVFSTHSVGGLSKNDFICAAKIDALGTI